jgi:hypothetical protein
MGRGDEEADVSAKARFRKEQPFLWGGVLLAIGIDVLWSPDIFASIVSAMLIVGIGLRSCWYLWQFECSPNPRQSAATDRAENGPRR